MFPNNQRWFPPRKPLGGSSPNPYSAHREPASATIGIYKQPPKTTHETADNICHSVVANPTNPQIPKPLALPLYPASLCISTMCPPIYRPAYQSSCIISHDPQIHDKLSLLGYAPTTREIGTTHCLSGQARQIHFRHPTPIDHTPVVGGFLCFTLR